ncbi:MAG: tetratricopeptide repeat protein [Candidatus Omnitrophica bacterium]|nr:tetratricopeptide repeat protein [Candidatus Omnitrophota bacterium]
MKNDNVPREVKDHYEKAQIAIDRKNYPYAIDLLTHAINIKPDSAKARQLLRLAEVKLYEEKPHSALSVIISRFFSLFRMFVAMINETKGNYHDAIAIYEGILKNDPKNGAVLLKLGIVLKLEGMQEAAAETLEDAIEGVRNSAVAYALLAEMHSNLGNYERARQCFKKVLEIKPGDHTAERGLKNLDALTTIDRSFSKKKADLNIREITE